MMYSNYSVQMHHPHVNKTPRYYSSVNQRSNCLNLYHLWRKTMLITTLHLMKMLFSCLVWHPIKYYLHKTSSSPCQHPSCTNYWLHWSIHAPTTYQRTFFFSKICSILEESVQNYKLWATNTPSLKIHNF